MKALSKRTVKSIVIAAILLLSAVLVFVFRSSLIPGWYEENGERYYLEMPFRRASGLVTIGNKKYVFSDYGSHALIKGWCRINGERYYTDKNGVVVTGEYVIDGETYLFQNSGKIYLNEARIIGGKFWYFGDHGFKVSGIVEIDEEKYCFKETGNLRTGLVTVDGKKYYFNTSGGHNKEAMMYGFITVNGINIGRYYNERGPQKTLYVPAPFLKEGKNEIIVFETDSVSDGVIEFTDTYDLG